MGFFNFYLNIIAIKLARFARVLSFSAPCVVQNQLIIIGWLRIYDYKGEKKIFLSKVINQTYFSAVKWMRHFEKWTELVKKFSGESFSAVNVVASSHHNCRRIGLERRRNLVFCITQSSMTVSPFVSSWHSINASFPSFLQTPNDQRVTRLKKMKFYKPFRKWISLLHSHDDPMVKTRISSSWRKKRSRRENWHKTCQCWWSP